MDYLKKKSSESNSNNMEKMAKKNVLTNLKHTAQQAMAGKLAGLKGKVDLGEPKDKSEDGGGDMPFAGKESPAEEVKEYSMMEDVELENCSPEELDEKIQHLMALKEKKLKEIA